MMVVKTHCLIKKKQENDIFLNKNRFFCNEVFCKNYVCNLLRIKWCETFLIKNETFHKYIKKHVVTFLKAKETILFAGK